VHVAVLVRPGPLLDVVVRFLRANRLNYKRLDTLEIEEMQSSTVRVLVLPTGPKLRGKAVSSAELVVALDSTVNAAEDYVCSLRRDLVRPNKQSTLVRLAVANSPEHIERCIPPTLDAVLRQQVLISCVLRARESIGTLPDGYPGVAAAAAKVAEFVLSKPGSGAGWPLPALGRISCLDSILESQPSSLQESGQSLLAPTQAQRGNKRIWVSISSVYPKACERFIHLGFNTNSSCIALGLRELRDPGQLQEAAHGRRGKRSQRRHVPQRECSESQDLPGEYRMALCPLPSPRLFFTFVFDSYHFGVNMLVLYGGKLINRDTASSKRSWRNSAARSWLSSA
jgi:hypothetical protein